MWYVLAEHVEQPVVDEGDDGVGAPGARRRASRPVEVLDHAGAALVLADHERGELAHGVQVIEVERSNWPTGRSS